MAKVYNRKTPGAIPKGAVYIGRGSRWGNPYVIGINGDRAAVIEMYKYGVTNYHYGGTGGVSEFPSPREIQEKLRDKDLVCYCAPEACHGDYLLELANGPCVVCSNGTICVEDTGDMETSRFALCPVCKGDSRQ